MDTNRWDLRVAVAVVVCCLAVDGYFNPDEKFSQPDIIYPALPGTGKKEPGQTFEIDGGFHQSHVLNMYPALPGTGERQYGQIFEMDGASTR